jgi:hypothetical protein
MNCAPALAHRSLVGWKAWVTGPSQADANHQADDEDDQHDNDKRLWIYRHACAPFCSLPGTKRERNPKFISFAWAIYDSATITNAYKADAAIDNERKGYFSKN